MDSKDTFFSKKRTINFRGTLFDISSPVIMGVINITPDSFYRGSRTATENEILKRCFQMIDEGADIIDIGAYSSRPGAEHIQEDEELARLLPALTGIRKEFPELVLSVDTFRSEIAERVIHEFNVQLINDISAGESDGQMFATVAKNNVAYVMMHMKGTPQTMQENTGYANMVKDMMHYFASRLVLAKAEGIKDIIIDPGFGFGKTMEQNYELLHRLDEFRIFELPILAGLSRKSMIYQLLETEPQGALPGTIAANTMALLNGADILRVHDVKEARDTIKIVSAYKNSYI
jgi:dihydropteroate synthase